MDENQINRYLSRYRNYLGTFARDELSFIIHKNQGIIINTDKSDGPGLHWVAIYMDERAIYFDSFGLPPLHKEIIIHLDTISPYGWYYNTVNFQSIYQDTCGLHAAYFIISMIETRDFESFMSVFRHSTHINDVLTKLLYKITKR